MKKREIDVFDHMNEIVNGIRKGALLTASNGEKTNSMIISWGTVGIEWASPVFITFVREHRFTRTLLEENGEFVISIPTAPLDAKGKAIFKVCGMQSGRDVDKVAETGMTLVAGEEVSVPGVAEWPLTLECKVVHKQLQDSSVISTELQERFYPQDVDWHDVGANQDYHVAYYGEIVRAYVIEEA